MAWLLLLVFFVLSLSSIILSAICLGEIRNLFIQRWLVLFITLAALLLIFFYLCCVWFVINKKSILIKTSISIYVFVVFCLTFTCILQKTGFFEFFQDVNQLQEYLQKAGVWMPLFYIVLQFLQVIVLPIPSIISTVAGVALFGALKAMIYSVIGIVIGSIVAFYIGRKFGNKAVCWMLGEETVFKWQKKLKGKDNLFLTLMFLLPLFPDDILCFFAGLSTMTWQYFFIMIFLTRAIGIAGTCYSVDFIPFNTWWGIGIWLLLFVGAVTLVFVIYKNMDKIQRILKGKKK